MKERKFPQKWDVIPILLAIWWIFWTCVGVFPSVIMLVADLYSIHLLGKYEEHMIAIQPKRTHLLLLDVPVCIVLFCLGAFFEGSQFLNNFFTLICPPALFLINIRTYIKNACDGKMFAALLFTDPLMHYMSIFVVLLIYWW